jgi:HAD superfamily hydrolase (TIGR01509 family)
MVDAVIAGDTLGVIFDYDGVLVNSMPAHAEAWQRAFRRFTKTDIPIAEFYSREGESRERTVADLFKAVSGHVPDRQQTREIIARRDAYYRARRTRLFPHVRELLVTLQEKGLLLAIVSGNLDLARELKERDLDRFFPVVISPADARRMKPHPDPYLAAVEQLRLPPGRCIVIENSPLGILAARRASLCCIAVKANSPLTAEVLRNCGARVVFRSVAGLFAFVRNQRGLRFPAISDARMRSRTGLAAR